MYADKDYEQCQGCENGVGHWKGCIRTHVFIEGCKEKGYSVVNVRSLDRPKLLFDTVCVLTDLHYVVFHASVSSKGSFADQEYFIRHKDGCTLDKESERKKLTQCLMAASVKNKVDGTTQLCFKVDGDCSYTSRAGTLQPRKRRGLYQEVKVR
ncbi:hypothetical protein Pint_11814 [Pistacia integerrima]|uniref:Uncharacterized protein n=1 Tax=Pistacia integerrima TaxID=434235 RepID=A0ACC0XJT8_9ROSI|nr:hypothetical protein Pint_11814 [Pistacia integerrima]